MGAAALTVAGSVDAPARAAAPMAGKQGPSFYRYKIGEFEVTTLNEGVVRNATPANMAVDRKSTRLNSSHRSLSRMPSSA